MGILDKLLGVPEKVEERSTQVINLSDPALAQLLGISGPSGITVTEHTALGVTAFYRAISIVAGTIAGLPLKTYTDSDNNKRRVKSFLDNPANPYPLTPFAWKELVMVHLLMQGEVFLLHIYNGAGALIGLWPVHRSAVDVEWVGADKRFTIQLDNGEKAIYTTRDMTHVMGLTTDGLRGIPPLAVFRNTIKLGIAGDTVAMKSFTNGMLISGLVTPDGDMNDGDAEAIKDSLTQKMTGVETAGDIVVINRSLKFSPWSMTNEDAQFLQSREFQVEEFARMFGVPVHLLAATEKQTSWGTGVAEQNLGLARYTLMPHTSRLEEALSGLLPNPRFCEFDYAGLLQGSPADEIKLLIEQVGAGLLTLDEARAIRNLPPLPKEAKAPTTPKGEGDEDE